jgi:glucan 1,3-beta-glucosidase
MVLEPWITPSLFYQFLGASKRWGENAQQHVALDSRSFCCALGESEANRQLRLHWATWVGESEIKRLSMSGIDTLRIPIADWMFLSYWPFTNCWEGSLEELDRVLALCEKYRLKVVLDLHALRGSQNGLDNSGDTGHLKWIQGREGNNTVPILRYEHWRMRGGDWAGEFDSTSQSYLSLNESHILDTLEVIHRIALRFRDNSVVVGLEPGEVCSFVCVVHSKYLDMKFM